MIMSVHSGVVKEELPNHMLQPRKKEKPKKIGYKAVASVLLYLQTMEVILSPMSHLGLCLT